MSITALDFASIPKSQCTCGHIACVCNIKKNHNHDCKFMRSATCPVPIECEHGRDVCPICDPCDCDREAK